MKNKSLVSIDNIHSFVFLFKKLKLKIFSRSSIPKLTTSKVYLCSSNRSNSSISKKASKFEVQIKETVKFERFSNNFRDNSLIEFYLNFQTNTVDPFEKVICLPTTRCKTKIRRKNNFKLESIFSKRYVN